MLKKLIEWRVKSLIKKHEPKIVVITGGRGKTLAKEAITIVLRPKLQVFKSGDGATSQATILAALCAFPFEVKNWWGWWRLWYWSVFTMNRTDWAYPATIIVELNLKRPGDAQYLLKFIRPNVVVITGLQTEKVHGFVGAEEWKEEHLKFLRALKSQSNSIVIYNYDDEVARAIIPTLGFNSSSYGLTDGDIVAQNISLDGVYPGVKQEITDLHGIKFMLSYSGQSFEVDLPRVWGEPNVSAALAAFAVGVNMEFAPVDIAACLGQYKGVFGCLELLPGIKRTLLIDDTRHSTPETIQFILAAMKQIDIVDRAKEIMVLGDMHGFGANAAQIHYDVGQLCARSVDLLITVGSLAQYIAQGALEGGMSQDKVFSFSDGIETGKFLQEMMKEGDLVVIKGEHAEKMEYIIREVMAEPLRFREITE